MSSALEDLMKITEIAVEVIPGQRINQTTLDYTLTTLLCTVVENVSACIQLINGRHYSTVPTILRATLEATVHFQNLINDPNYINALIASEANQNIRIVDRLKKSTNLSGSLRASLEEIYSKNKKLLNSTDKKYHKYVSMPEACALAQNEKNPENTFLYLLYQFYCMDAHNSLGALGRRHFNEGKVELFYRPDQHQIDKYIDQLASLLVISLTQFFQHIAVKSIRVEEARKIYDQMEKRVAPHN